VGFCYGGGIVNLLATRVPDLAAGVAFYGSAPNLEDVPKIKTALLIQSAEVDERINASWPAYEAALKAANLRYERHVQHATWQADVPARAAALTNEVSALRGSTPCAKGLIDRELDVASIDGDLGAPVRPHQTFT
jgi:dienelactone hydrolase